MLNLIPVVMFLLVQGAGGTDLSLRQQQALLDLAHRVRLAQDQREIGAVLATEAGVSGADLAYWLQVFTAAPHASEPELATEEPQACRHEPHAPADEAHAECARPRDGPAAS